MPYFYAEKSTPEVQPARLVHVTLSRKVSRCKIPTLLYELSSFCELLDLFTLEIGLRC